MVHYNLRFLTAVQGTNQVLWDVTLCLLKGGNTSVETAASFFRVKENKEAARPTEMFQPAYTKLHGVTSMTTAFIIFYWSRSFSVFIGNRKQTAVIIYTAGYKMWWPAYMKHKL